MKLTKQRLIEIIKEEYKKVLNEKTVRLKTMDINFNSADQAQILGMKGKMAITKQGAKTLLFALQKEWGRDITGL
jgi:hypothetical protein|tara:strand:+ start:235 stop:459 length:225 start_codon:yes stop_codon:yes gene_type:complete